MRGNVFEAFGTRPSEVGSTQDRQKANTKDEESDLGLLNEGFRWRELSTGTFLTRDPLGFVDGPNMYSYVNDNPWTKFDPEGLSSYFDVVGLYQANVNAYKEAGSFSGYVSKVFSKENALGHLRTAQETFVPGQVAFENSVSSFQKGNVAEGIQHASQYVAEVAMTLATAEASQMAASATKAAVPKSSAPSAETPSPSASITKTATEGEVTAQTGGAKQVSKVDNLVSQIEESGAKVKVNPKTPNQEGNVTLDYGHEGRVNLRVESHPLEPGGEPVRHANVETVKEVNNKKTVENVHIIEKKPKTE